MTSWSALAALALFLRATLRVLVSTATLLAVNTVENRAGFFKSQHIAVNLGFYKNDGTWLRRLTTFARISCREWLVHENVVVLGNVGSPSFAVLWFWLWLYVALCCYLAWLALELDKSSTRPVVDSDEPWYLHTLLHLAKNFLLVVILITAICTTSCVFVQALNWIHLLLKEAWKVKCWVVLLDFDSGDLK